MVKIGDVVCPRCTEDRETLISKINDPMGERYVCMVCSCEFRITASAPNPEAPRLAARRL